MKVLLIHDYGTPTGGAELQMLTLRRQLRERGHNARLFSSTISLVPGSFEADYGCQGATGRKQALVQTINLSARRELRRALSDFQPDVVHVRMFLWQLSPAILPLLKNYPCLFHVATYKCVCPTGFKLLPNQSQCHYPAGAACLKNHCVTPQTWVLSMIQLRLFRHWRRVFGATVALSNHMRRVLEENNVGPVEVIHNGVPERASRPPLPDEPVVAYAGRLSREKGVDILLRAFAIVRSHVPSVRLLIAGSGPDRERLQALAVSLGVESAVTWLGHLPRETMEREFERVWVQAAPSLWNEAFGNVATEASMRGTAVVCTATGGLAEIVEDGITGFQVPPGNHQLLATALGSILSNKQLAERMGMAGRQRALTEFSENKSVSKLLQLYERLIDAKPSRALAGRQTQTA